MAKKSTSTSNVPQSNQKSHENRGKSPQKEKGHSQSNLMNQSHGNASTAVLNSKHLHNQSAPKIKPKTKRTDPSLSKNSNNNSNNNNDNSSNASNTSNGSEESLLMKKLFEAVQKQKIEENSSNKKPRSRKGTAPTSTSSQSAKPINSSETYAGAAFDRAPAATSFPIPSFVKAPPSEKSSLSTSFPLPGALESKTMNSPTSPNLKPLSISELFKPEAAEPEAEQKIELESLTNDLRKILNLR